MENVTDLPAEKVVKTRKGRTPKNFNIHNNNTAVYTGFLSSLKEATANQYRVSVAPFLQSLGQKSLASVTVAELEAFCTSGKNDAKNQALKVHVTCLLKWSVRNVEGFSGKVSRDVLVWLI